MANRLTKKNSAFLAFKDLDSEGSDDERSYQQQEQKEKQKAKKKSSKKKKSSENSLLKELAMCSGTTAKKGKAKTPAPAATTPSPSPSPLQQTQPVLEPQAPPSPPKAAPTPAPTPAPAPAPPVSFAAVAKATADPKPITKAAPPQPVTKTALPQPAKPTPKQAAAPALSVASPTPRTAISASSSAATAQKTKATSAAATSTSVSTASTTTTIASAFRSATANAARPAKASSSSASPKPKPTLAQASTPAPSQPPVQTPSVALASDKSGAYVAPHARTSAPPTSAPKSPKKSLSPTSSQQVVAQHPQSNGQADLGAIYSPTHITVTRADGQVSREIAVAEMMDQLIRFQQLNTQLSLANRSLQEQLQRDAGVIGTLQNEVTMFRQMCLNLQAEATQLRAVLTNSMVPANGGGVQALNGQAPLPFPRGPIGGAGTPARPPPPGMS